MIMKETNGRGVDLVLNSLTGEKLLASVRCLAQGGRMIEIGKYDITSNSSLDLPLFQKQGSFHGTMLDILLNDHLSEALVLSKFLMEGITEGSVKPLNRHIFEFNEVEQAFRFMASGKHMGKVVIKVRSEKRDIHLQELFSQEFPAVPK